ncbi:MAG: hypothetical protein EON57_05645 [Alphaproteobacteria bacterium]|nr:MAG: hypothetical protein EON57_05645 [Alphaproteobacteria bacterium]
MRKAMLGLAIPLILLAGCEMKVGKDDGDKGDASLKIGADGNVAITADDGADGVSVSVPGFEAKVKVPGIEMGGENLDIDGIKLYPGSKLKGINVTDQKGPGNGLVDMRFTSPAAPDKVAAHFAQAARDNDFTAVNVTNAGGTATMTAKKADGDDLTITMEPAKDGTEGRILIKDGSKE